MQIKYIFKEHTFCLPTMSLMPVGCSENAVFISLFLLQIFGRISISIVSLLKYY